MSKKCLGCGSIMQSEDSSKAGFVKENKIEEALYCERCFKIKHYGKSYLLDKKVDIEKFIKEINKEDKGVLYLIDSTTISETTLSLVKKLRGKVYVILTKIDLLPKSIKLIKLINYVKDKTGASNVFVISSKKKYNIDLLKNKLINDGITSCYSIGYSNAGKSSLINSFLESEGKKGNITVSSFPNTTIENIMIKLNKITIIDTPGFVNEKSILNFIDMDLYKQIYTKKEIKPKIHVLKSDFMILLDGIMRIENNSGNNTNLVFFLSNDISLIKIRSVRNETLKDFEKVSLTINEGEDLVIEGLGFIKVTKKAVIDVYVKDKKVLSVRDKLI